MIHAFYETLTDMVRGIIIIGGWELLKRTNFLNCKEWLK